MREGELREDFAEMAIKIVGLNNPKEKDHSRPEIPDIGKQIERSLLNTQFPTPDQQELERQIRAELRY